MRTNPASLLPVHLALLFATTAWGGSFVAARLLLAGEGTVLSPILLATLRFALASAIFVPLLLVQVRKGESLRAADLPMVLLLGQLGISGYFWLQYTGVQLTSAGVAAILVVGLMPVATSLVARLMLGEPFGPGRLAALAVGASGVAIVTTQRDLRVALESGFLLGVACLVANSLSFAFYSTLVRRLRPRYSSLALTGSTTMTGTAGLLALSAVEGGWSAVAELSATQWWAIAYLVVACSVLAYFAYNFALARLHAGQAVTWLYLEPVVAVIAGALLLGEQITPHTIAGGALIAASVCLVQRS